MKDNRRARGNAFQKWICTWLEKNYGMVTHNQISYAKWLPHIQKWTSFRNDILGCIDCIGVNDKRIVFIQATLHTGVGKKIRELSIVSWPKINGVDIELWVKRGPRRITIINALTNTKRGEIINGKFIVAKEE
jgi:hypothetical protein